jgi:hypothetical protein
LLVVHREPAEAALLAGRLRDRGIDAHPYLSLGSRGFREIRANPPDAILIDLTRAPSYGKAIGALLRENKTLRTIPLILLEGDPVKTKATARVLPGAAVTDLARLPEVLAECRPCADPAPPRPSRRSIAAKLGIDGTVTLLNPPEGWSLPLSGKTSVVPVEQGAVVLFWARNEAALARELPGLAGIPGKGRRLWLLWPKRTSKVVTNLTMPRVREIAIQNGLVDYKVCAVDEVWSGMAVGQRR